MQYSVDVPFPEVAVYVGNPLGLILVGLGQSEGQDAKIILGGNMILIDRIRQSETPLQGVKVPFPQPAVGLLLPWFALGSGLDGGETILDCHIDDTGWNAKDGGYYHVTILFFSYIHGHGNELCALGGRAGASLW